MADVDVEFLAPSEVLRVSSAGVREAQGRRLRALQGETVDIPSRKNAGSERPMNSAGALKAFQQRIVAVAQQKLGRPLTGREPAFHHRRGRVPRPGDDPRHRGRRDPLRA